MPFSGPPLDGARDQAGQVPQAWLPCLWWPGRHWCLWAREEGPGTLGRQGAKARGSRLSPAVTYLPSTLPGLSRAPSSFPSLLQGRSSCLLEGAPHRRQLLSHSDPRMGAGTQDCSHPAHQGSECSLDWQTRAVSTLSADGAGCTVTDTWVGQVHRF